MNGIEAVQRERKSIGQVKLKRIVGLRSGVYADDLKSCPRVAGSGSARSAEQVK